MKEFFDQLQLSSLIASAVIIAVAVALWLLVKRVFRRYFQRADVMEKVRGKRETHIKMLLNLLKYLLAVVAVICVLQVYGVNVTSLVAGLGIASAIAGLAMQDMLRDIVMGTHIVADEFFVLGDVVRFGEHEGEVVSFTVRSTKLRDLATGDLLTVCNRDITEVTKRSGAFVLDLPVAYEDDPAAVNAMLGSLCLEANALEPVESCDRLGVERLDDSSVAYRLLVRCRPLDVPSVRRAVLTLSRDVFARHGMVVPYNQLDVHTDSKL